MDTGALLRMFLAIPLVLGAVPAHAATVVDWSDDFSSYTTGAALSGSGGWSTGYSTDKWTVGGTSKYAVATTDDNGTGWGTGTATDNHLVYTGKSWSDFTLDGDLYSDDDDTIAVVFRYNDK